MVRGARRRVGRRVRLLAVGAASMVALAACAPVPRIAQAERDQIVGEWVLEDGTDVDPVLDLGENGLLTADAVPDVLACGEAQDVSPAPRRGAWYLYRDRDGLRQAVVVAWAEGCTTVFQVALVDSRLGLVTFLDDGDGRWITFRRSASQPGTAPGGTAPEGTASRSTASRSID